ncbi:MAG: hypothetical protein PHI23_01820 [Candidatus Peribacteraceae bacterium]|nr:hypothetical protein [Candidatus Peribacteraceae bacterium]
MLLTPLLVASLLSPQFALMPAAAGTSPSGQGTLTAVVQTLQSGSVPPGAQRVPMLLLTLSASCGEEIPVTGLTLRHRGMGETSDLEAVYVMRGGQRLTRGRTFSSRDGRLRIDLRDFSVPACGTSQLTVLADFASSAAPAGEHRMVIERARRTSMRGGERLSFGS